MLLFACLRFSACFALPLWAQTTPLLLLLETGITLLVLLLLLVVGTCDIIVALI